MAVGGAVYVSAPGYRTKL